ncbi:hypothetical protein FRB99_007081 [Tulasnella sp. 403]|nr:hypothetical protein FRB99_007081 [Tulasnella sp. 403]
MAQAPTALQSPPAPDDKRIRFPKTPGDIDLLQPGDVVQSWDPWFVWDEFCESNATREKWRQMGDPLCDAALEAMFSSSSSSMNGVDLLEELVKQSEGISDPENPICSFLHSVSQMPPEGISATPEEIERAQSYFATHSMAITTAMMHFSLAGSFAS